MIVDCRRRALPLQWALGDLDAVAPNLSLVREALGGVDVLVNITGIPPPTLVSGEEPAAWRKFFDSMVRSVIAITDAVLPEMRSKKWGRIITSASSGIVAPIPNLGLSNALRSSLVGWSKTLAGEVGRDSITKNVIVPGRIATQRITFLDEQARPSGTWRQHGDDSARPLWRPAGIRRRRRLPGERAGLIRHGLCHPGRRRPDRQRVRIFR